ncbi:MAG: hypothetical protein Nkreftii_002285 [Candidatus Nitrospira kreftii]|uniref:Uncharacterized protein n=1 Tax=Candidatus Nitrospira kreftii TaxID=2652173 RepID=A0A7S8FEU4_9BACT|nr:MAG: hypothetical protein Nkreftii_002285 [Candidatus Nitrospira kreftii]
MASEEWLSIDYKNCSPHELLSLLKQLEGGDHPSIRASIQRELIDRLKALEMSDRQIVDVLLQGVGYKAKRNKIAKEWAPIFGITAEEFKRIAFGN